MYQDAEKRFLWQRSPVTNIVDKKLEERQSMSSRSVENIHRKS